MSQIELSKELKVTSQALSQYEWDKRMHDTFMLKKSADFLDVTIDHLLCRIHIRNPLIRIKKNQDSWLNPIIA